MTTIDLSALVNEAVDIQNKIDEIKKAQLNDLEKALKLIKKQIQEELERKEEKEFEAANGKALLVTQNRKKVDTKGLYEKFDITEEVVAEFTSPQIVKFVKISEE